MESLKQAALRGIFCSVHDDTGLLDACIRINGLFADTRRNRVFFGASEIGIAKTKEYFPNKNMPLASAMTSYYTCGARIMDGTLRFFSLFLSFFCAWRNDDKYK
jgi:hypothetical protein